MKTPLNPIRTARAVEIIKQQKSIARNYRRLAEKAEAMNAPLWTEQKRLRDLVATLERSLRTVANERDTLRQRLDEISAAIAA